MRGAFLSLLSWVLIAFGSPAVAEIAELEKLAAKKAAIIELMHRKARKALVTAAQDSAYSDYFTDHRSQGERQALKQRIDQISLRVQSRFHVEEMCLIDPDGAEISRIVGDEIAHDLALDEADAMFFRPGFAQPPRQVHTSPIYMSPDAKKWVVAYVTPVMTQGQKRAILHYEHDLASYQAALDDGSDGREWYVLAVDDNGWIISDSRRPVPLLMRSGSEAHEDYFEPFRLGAIDLADLRSRLGGDARRGAGTMATDSGRFEAAYHVAGDWTVIVIEPS